MQANHQWCDYNYTATLPVDITWEYLNCCNDPWWKAPCGSLSINLIGKLGGSTRGNRTYVPY